MPLNSDFIKKSLKSISIDINNGKYQVSIDQIYKLSKIAPKNDVLYFELGRVYILMDEFPLAVHNFKTAVLLNPKEPILWQALLNAVILDLDTSEKTEFRNKVKKAPISDKIKQKLLSKLDKKYKGVVLPLNGVPISKLNELGKLLVLKQMEKLVEKAEKLLLDFPNAPAVLSYLGAAQFSQTKLDLSLASFLKARDLVPDCAEIYNNIAGIHVANKNIKEALGQYKEAFIREPNSTSIMTCLADAYYVEKKYPVAIKYLEQLSKTVVSIPELININKKLGHSHIEIDKNEEAIEVLSRTNNVYGVEDLDTLIFLVTALQNLMRNDEALVIAEKGLSISPNHGRLLTLKAVSLQHSGKFKEAQKIFMDAIKIDPNSGHNYKSYVTSKKILPGDPIVEEMISVLKDGSLSDADRMSLCFALSKASEDIKAYDKVFEYLNQASTIMCNLYPYDIKHRINEISLIKKSFSKVGLLDGQVGISDYSPIFITGMPRSGTTLVEQIISSHSKVVGAGELGYFNEEIENSIYQLNHGKKELVDIPKLLTTKHEHNSKLQTVAINYQNRVEKLIPGKKIFTDKSIGTYLYIGLVKAVFPKAKVIVVKRDPRDNLLSVYKNMFREGTHRYAYNFKNLAVFYDTFIQMVDFWREQAPGSFYEVSYEALVADPEIETKKLIEACNLPWEDACLSPQNNERVVKTLSVFQVRQPISATSVKSWKRYEGELSEMFNELRELGHIN